MLPSLFKKLLLVRELKYRGARFYLMADVEGVIMPAITFVSMFKMLYDEFGEKAWAFIKKYGRHAAEICHNLVHVKMAGKSVSKNIEFVLEVAHLTGFGEFKLVGTSLSQGVIEADSTIGYIWHKFFGKSDVPVCKYLEGYIERILELLTNEKYECKEVQCIAQGYNKCRFVFERKGKKESKN